MLKSAAALSVVALLTVAAGAGPSLTVDGRTALASFMQGAVARGDAPAVAAIVVNRSDTLFVAAEGKMDVARTMPMTPAAIFRMASMTKPVTSLAVMMLYEQGRIGLDDPVTKFLPEFANVRVLMSMHS